jgi:hypothetical protein
VSEISRRRLLASLAAGPLYRDFAKAEAAPAITPGRSYKWSVARERFTPTEQHVVDFWASPACKIRYGDQLPPQIVRGAICHEREADPVKPIDKLCWLRGDLEVLQSGGSEALEHWLHTIAETMPARVVTKTALLALDSASGKPAGPSWSDLLPSFRRCYDHVIGHFHIEQRGFVHWKAALLADGGDAKFDEIFAATTSHCDAVIFTNYSLAENDHHLPARISTEALVSELMRRLGEVLLDKHLLTEIVPPKNTDYKMYRARSRLAARARAPFLLRFHLAT